MAINKVVKKLQKYRPTREKSPQRIQNNIMNTPKKMGESYQNFKFKLQSPKVDNDSVQMDKVILENMHPEALQFLRKYFNGCNSRCVAIYLFLYRLLNDFQHLWYEDEALSILPYLIVRLRKLLGSEFVNLSALDSLTRENGLMGMVLLVLQEIGTESPRREISPYVQNILNIIQYFVYGLYKEAEKTIYTKLNATMKRLMVKHQEAEDLVTRLNEHIVYNAGYVDQNKKTLALKKQYEDTISELRANLASVQGKFQQSTIYLETLKVENYRLVAENERLIKTVEMFQSHLLKTLDDTEDRRQNRCRTNTFYADCPNPNDFDTQRTKGKHKKLFDVYEIKKGISSILTEKSQKDDTPIRRDTIKIETIRNDTVTRSLCQNHRGSDPITRPPDILQRTPDLTPRGSDAAVQRRN